MADSHNIPEPLRRGRRALEGLPFFELLEDYIWHPKVERWALQCRLRTSNGGDSVLTSARWFVVVPQSYPWGDIDIYPAKEGGIEVTYPHQNFNAAGDPDVPWRDGKICQHTSLRNVGRRGYDREPLIVTDKLLWHITRAHEWVEAASQNHLVVDGDPFELPHIPFKTKVGIAFNEDTHTHDRWRNISADHGTAAIMRSTLNGDLRCVTAFNDMHGATILSLAYGSALPGDTASEETALWIRLQAMPIIVPWQIPTTFGALQDTLSTGMDIRSLLLGMAHLVRDGLRHILLIGAPVPMKHGQPPERIHWLAAMLPAFSYGNHNGFRNTEEGHRRRDEAMVLKRDTSIDWVPTSNWSKDQLLSRARSAHSIQDKNVLLVGVGALGSCVAELLVRNGVANVTLLDGDRCEVGNLCRHTAILSDVGGFKAEQTAKRLNAAIPHGSVKALNKEFAGCDSADRAAIDGADVVIDCTASDALLNDLAIYQWARPRLFVSVSIGLFARRLYYCAIQADSFPHEAFGRALSPWLSRELEENDGVELPRERIGCWHPVFPASCDDVWLMSSIAVKALIHDIEKMPSGGIVRVYEQTAENGCISKIHKVAEAACS